MASSAKTLTSCIFCKIIKGEIPSLKLVETNLSYSFLDINFLSRGHALIIPKYHAEKMHELPDEYLADPLPIAKKIGTAQGAENYNILQVVDNVYFHVISKPSDSDQEGLGIGWPQTSPTRDELPAVHAELQAKL